MVVNLKTRVGRTEQISCHYLSLRGMLWRHFSAEEHWVLKWIRIPLDTCGRANTIWIRYVWTEKFLNPQRKSRGFENIRRRVDRALYLKYANVPQKWNSTNKNKCEELYSVMNSVNDISPIMSLTVSFVVLYCCACRRMFQFLPGCFFRPVCTYFFWDITLWVLYSPNILSSG